MKLSINDKRHILEVNGKKYMFFLCYKSNNEFCIASINRNMIIQMKNEIINISFLSDMQLNIELKNIEFHLYAFLVDIDIDTNKKHIEFILSKFKILKDNFKSSGFIDNFNDCFIKIFSYKLNYYNIKSIVKKNKILNINDKVMMNFTLYDNKIMCSHPSIQLIDKELYDLLK